MLKCQCKIIQVVKLMPNINTPQIFVKKKLQDFEKFKLTLIFHLKVWFLVTTINHLFFHPVIQKRVSLFSSGAGNHGVKL